MSIQVMTWVFRLQIPPREKVVALAIADDADDAGDAFIQLWKIGAKASMSVGTVKRAIKQLMEWGLLEKEPQFTVSKRQSTNFYHLRTDRDAPFEIAEAVAVEGSKLDTQQDDDSENEAIAAASESAVGEGVQSAPLKIIEETAQGGSQIGPHEGVTGEPHGGVTADSPNNPFKDSALTNPPRIVPDFGSIKPPPLPGRKAAGSAGKDEQADPDSSEFIAKQFEQLKTIYQQFNKAGFIGVEQPAWAKFRKLPFDRRHAAVTKLPLCLKAFNAMYARWSSAKGDRGQKPKCPSLRDYICGELFDSIGWPKEPVAAPKPPNAAWAAALERMPLTPFDQGEKHFVEQGSEAWRVWVAAFERAGVPLLRMSPRRIASNGGREGDDPNAGKTGRYFAQALPPREEDFEQQSEPARGAA